MNRRRQYIELAERLSALADSLEGVNNWNYIDKEDKVLVSSLVEKIENTLDPIWQKSLNKKERKEIGLDS